MPRIAEIVAARLREQILSGEMRDGSALPTQERLVEEFRVSKQAVREGLRILELEGLITIRRGNVGGALVHLPSPVDAAYSLALVLQARRVSVGDVGSALKELEPICVELCARRADRNETVVPRLRAAVDEAVASKDDLSAWLDAQHRFHRILASDCGNEAIAVLAGSLEEVWLAHVRLWAELEERAGRFPDAGGRLAHGVADHEEMMSLIEKGAAKEAVHFAQHHIDEFYARASSPQTAITATTLNERFG
jgi:GntR family transcriptional regulator, transcriptional repressor for pyruvate dehydrogenase complex